MTNRPSSRCGSSKDGCRHLRPYPWRCLTRTQASHLPRDRHPTTSKPSHPLRPFAWDGVPSPRAHQRTSVGGDALRSGAMPTFLPQANEGLRSQREGLLRNPRCCAPSGFLFGSLNGSLQLAAQIQGTPLRLVRGLTTGLGLDGRNICECSYKRRRQVARAGFIRGSGAEGHGCCRNGRAAISHTDLRQVVAARIPIRTGRSRWRAASSS